MTRTGCHCRKSLGLGNKQGLAAGFAVFPVLQHDLGAEETKSHAAMREAASGSD